MIESQPKAAKLQQFLGLYLLLMGTAQTSLYVWMALHSDNSLFYIDPRIGILFFEGMIAREDFASIGLLRWFTVAIPLIFGTRFLKGRLNGNYLAIEITLSIPFILFSLFVLLANMSPAHGFSIRELTFPLLTFALFSGVPIAIATQLRRSEATKEPRP